MPAWTLTAIVCSVIKHTTTSNGSTVTGGTHAQKRWGLAVTPATCTVRVRCTCVCQSARPEGQEDAYYEVILPTICLATRIWHASVRSSIVWRSHTWIYAAISTTLEIQELLLGKKPCARIDRIDSCSSGVYEPAFDLVWASQDNLLRLQKCGGNSDSDEDNKKRVKFRASGAMPTPLITAVIYVMYWRMQNNCTTSDRLKRLFFQRCRLLLVVNVKKKAHSVQICDTVRLWNGRSMSNYFAYASTQSKYATLYGYETVARWALILHTPAVTLIL